VLLYTLFIFVSPAVCKVAPLAGETKVNKVCKVALLAGETKVNKVCKVAPLAGETKLVVLIYKLCLPLFH
jgi:hypothetical protein